MTCVLNAALWSPARERGKSSVCRPPGLEGGPAPTSRKHMVSPGAVRPCRGSGPPGIRRTSWEWTVPEGPRPEAASLPSNARAASTRWDQSSPVPASGRGIRPGSAHLDLSDKDPSENQNSPKWDRTSVSQAAAWGTGRSLEGTEGPSCRKASHPAKGDTTMHGAGETESAKPPRPTGTRGRPATTPVRGGGRGARSLSSGASPRGPRPRTAAERGWAQGQS